MQPSAMPRKLIVLAAVLGLGAPGWAQLDLPAKKTGDPSEEPGDAKPPREPARGNVAPYLVCRVCDVRNYTAKIEPDPQSGLQTTYCMVCRRPTVHQVPRKAGRNEGAGLELPMEAAPVPRETAGEPPPLQPLQGAPAAGTSFEAMTDAARLYFEEASRAKGLDDRVALAATDSLVALGDPGFTAARMALGSDNAVVAMSAIRVLLRSGRPEDADLVQRRFLTRLPAREATAMLREWTTLDPVRATPRFFAALLEHPQNVVRGAAEKALEPMMDADVVSALEGALASKVSDARQRALNLVTLVDDPLVLDVLLGMLSDPKATIAWSAVSTLADLSDARLELELLAKAFGDRWILRPNAYALLAVVEREDRHLVPLLGETHVESLLRGLGSSDPFVAGTCATALAGIGFRAADPRGTDWLDRDVPDRLIATISAPTFFNDYSSLQIPALRRLKDISGVSFGADGPRWAGWWVEARAHFRASRASMFVAEGEESGLSLDFRDGGLEPAAFTLLGPAVSVAAGEDRLGETFYLTASESREFVDLMRREAILSSSCLPGIRGARADLGRRLEITVAGQGKTFAFGPDASEPWFERAVGMARSLRDRNQWQRFPNPEEHVSRHALWEAQAAWWTEESDPFMRTLRLKELVLDYLLAVPPFERNAGIRALREMQPDAFSLEDVGALLEILRGEAFYVERGRDLFALALHALGLPLDADRPLELDATARAETERIIETLHQVFGADAAEDIGTVLALEGRERVRAAAADPRPLLRAVAAQILSREPDAADLEALMALLADPVERVEIAAVLALGGNRVEAARTELLLRARAGTTAVRVAALDAIGRLGGEGVRDVLTVSLSHADPEIKAAAAIGLARLEDPQTVPLLVSILRQGPEAAAYEEVRKGLLRLGPLAWDELFVALRSPNTVSQREAALLLAYQGVADSASVLMRLLTLDAADRLVSRELTILSCLDYSEEPQPAQAWWTWWDGVRHDDSLLWFRAALEKRGVTTPSAEEFEGEGSLETVRFLIEVMKRPESHLVERARRELERRLGRELGKLPEDAAERAVWLDTLYETILSSRE